MDASITLLLHQQIQQPLPVPQTPGHHHGQIQPGQTISRAFRGGWIQANQHIQQGATAALEGIAAIDQLLRQRRISRLIRNGRQYR